jgi:hypothetical protein
MGGDHAVSTTSLISPLAGEMSGRTEGGATERYLSKGDTAPPSTRLISPLEGEMPGWAEGGATERYVSELSDFPEAHP